MWWLLCQESTEEELERLLDKIMVLFRFIHGMSGKLSHKYIHVAIYSFSVANKGLLFVCCVID